MATIDKRGDKWRAQVRRKGLGSVSRSFINKKDAEKWGRETEAAIERGEFDPKPKAEAVDYKATTLAQLIEKYRDEVAVKKKGVKIETYVLDAFLKHPMATKALSDVTSVDWAKYRDERLKEIKAVSLKRQMCVFQHMYDIARKEWGYTKLANPLTDVKLEYVDQRRDRRLKEGEFEAIIAEAGKRKNKQIAPIIRWAVETGMRRGEILNLRWSHIDLKRRELLIPESKNGHSRILPVTKAMLSVLEGQDIETDAVFPIAEANFKSTLKRILKAVGLHTDLRMHDLRHEAISALFERGLAVQETASISGHKSWKMLARYTHPKPADILRKLEPVE